MLPAREVRQRVCLSSCQIRNSLTLSPHCCLIHSLTTQPHLPARFQTACTICFIVLWWISNLRLKLHIFTVHSSVVSLWCTVCLYVADLFTITSSEPQVQHMAKLTWFTLFQGCLQNFGCKLPMKLHLRKISEGNINCKGITVFLILLFFFFVSWSLHSPFRG